MHAKPCMNERNYECAFNLLHALVDQISWWISIPAGCRFVRCVALGYLFLWVLLLLLLPSYNACKPAGRQLGPLGLGPRAQRLNWHMPHGCWLMHVYASLPVSLLFSSSTEEEEAHHQFVSSRSQLSISLDLISRLVTRCPELKSKLKCVDAHSDVGYTLSFRYWEAVIIIMFRLQVSQPHRHVRNFFDCSCKEFNTRYGKFRND